MILSPWDPHAISVFPASLDRISATPYVWKAISSSWPDHTGPSLEFNLCPTCIQWASLIPRTAKLLFITSTAIWLLFHIVRAFYVPIFIVALVVRIGIGIVTSEEYRISLWGIIIFQNENPLTPRTAFEWFKWFLLVTFFGSVVSYGMRLLTTHPILVTFTGVRPTVALGSLQDKCTGRIYPSKIIADQSGKYVTVISMTCCNLVWVGVVANWLRNSRMYNI